MNYQYRYGTSTTEAVHTLYADGGWTRYYQGLTPALVQGPVSRFGDTAANAGILALLESNTYMKNLPYLVQTLFASLAAAAFRMILTPIDTLKTTLQTQGKPGWKILKARVSFSIPFLSYGGLKSNLFYSGNRSRGMVLVPYGTERSPPPPQHSLDITLYVYPLQTSYYP